MPRRLPGICYHKGAQRYYVTLDGTEVYLSKRRAKEKTTPPEVQAAYDAKVGRWLQERQLLPEPVGPQPTLDELWSGYLAAIEAGPKYHRDGVATSEVQLIRDACRIAARLFGEVKAELFGPLKLKAVRAEFIEAGWTRESINKATHRVKRMFRWGVEHELIPESVWRALQAVPDLTKSELPRGNVKVADVDDRVLEETLKHLPANLAAMVRAHRLIGCRAQEICVARTCDFDLDADDDTVSEAEKCWLFTPTESKTGEAYWVGPQAQAVLQPLLDPKHPEAWLFPTRRRGRGCWRTASYRRVVARVCRKHKLPHWSPLQLRHAAAEEARRKHPAGLEAVQARLRHKEMQVSQLYAHDLSALGRDVARKLG